MNQKPKIIYILIILWIVIGVLVFGIAVKRTLDHLDSIDSISEVPNDSLPTMNDSITTYVTFSYVMYTILYTIIIVLSFILAYGTFIKKSWSWDISIMLSAFLTYFVFTAIFLIGSGVIMGQLDQIFNNFESVANILMLFFVPCLIVLLTRPEVKAYLGKRIVQTREREIKTFNKMTTKTIKCPACGEIQEVQGVLGEGVEVTCKKCNVKGVFKFHNS